MPTKIKQTYTTITGYLAQLKDLRVVGQLLFLAVVLMISWSGVRVIETNYQLQRQIAQLSQENDLQELENQNARLENAYYDTAQYLELAARERFGLAAPGEVVYNVPRSVALKYTLDPPSKPVEPTAAERPPVYQQNFQAWLDFLLHRQNVTPER